MQTKLKEKSILNIVFLTSPGQNYCHISLKLKDSELIIKLPKLRKNHKTQQYLLQAIFSLQIMHVGLSCREKDTLLQILRFFRHGTCIAALLSISS